MPSGAYFHFCEICTSPFRTEIESLLRQRYQRTEIAKKYLNRFSCNLDTLRRKVARHQRHMDKAPSSLIVMKNSQQSGHILSRVNLEHFAQRLLEIGDQMIREKPERVKLHDVISSQKLLLEQKRLRVSEDSLRLAVAQIFGGVIVEESKSLGG